MDTKHSSHLSQNASPGAAPPEPIHQPASAKPRFGGILAVIGAAVALSTLGVWQFIRTVNVRRGAVVETIAPGLTLARETVHTPTEDIPILTLRADIRQDWKLRLAPAAELVAQKRPVSQIASSYNATHGNRAPVAVNGGFFAYEGAAVGAVKMDGEWMRLPWKNRTSIGWDDGSKPFIDNLSARAFVRTEAGEVAVANLNGWPSASTCALLTWRVGPSYTLKAGEAAAILGAGRVIGVVASGKVELKRGVQVLVAGAQSPQAAAIAALKTGDAASFEVEATPARWNTTRTILGAGPRLVAQGALVATYVQEEFRPDVIARGPRTMVGIDAKGGLIIMVIEAWFKPPTAEKGLRGMTLDAAAAEMQRAGAVEAINLDGGSSTTMWVRGQTVTAASDLVQDKRIIEKAAVRREVGVANVLLIEHSERGQMIEFTSGDLLRAPADYIAQGVATGSQESLGMGLALKISARWPIAQKKFKKHTRCHSFEGGDLFVVRPEDGQPGVIYIATQPDMYHASLGFVSRGLRSLALYCARNSVVSVALPKIGAGLGKLDWGDVKPLMEKYLSSGETLFRVYEDFKLDYEAS